MDLYFVTLLFDNLITYFERPWLYLDIKSGGNCQLGILEQTFPETKVTKRNQAKKLAKPNRNGALIFLHYQKQMD